MIVEALRPAWAQLLSELFSERPGLESVSVARELAAAVLRELGGDLTPEALCHGYALRCLTGVFPKDGTEAERAFGAALGAHWRRVNGTERKGTSLGAEAAAGATERLSVRVTEGLREAAGSLDWSAFDEHRPGLRTVLGTAALGSDAALRVALRLSGARYTVVRPGDIGGDHVQISGVMSVLLGMQRVFEGQLGAIALRHTWRVWGNEPDIRDVVSEIAGISDRIARSERLRRAVHSLGSG